MSDQPRSTSEGDLFAAVHARTSREALAAAVAGLDPEQAAAATAGDGGNMVRAGAGTGKTRALVTRIAHLVGQRGEAPSSITVVTYTNKADREIRARLGPLLGEVAAKEVRMGTFHALGARIMRRNARAAGLRPGFVVLDEDDARRLLREVIVQGGHVPEGGDPTELLEATLRTVRSWKAWGLAASAVENPERARRGAEDERIGRVYVAYQYELTRRNLVDFGDLVLVPATLMRRDDEVRHREAGAVRHLLVDEAQDANPAQVLFARQLASVHHNVFAVGDEDQSIFGFQGGYPDAIRQLAGPGSREFVLVRNRRCTEQILAPAVGLVNLNSRRTRKELRSGMTGPEPGIALLASEREEGDRVVTRVKELVAAGSPLSEIAVLARSAFAFSSVEEAMLKAGLAYEVTGGMPFVEREEVRDVTSYLRLALDPTDRLAFERIANRPTRGIGPQALDALLARQSATDEPFHEACANLTSMDGLRLTGAHREGLDSLARALQGLASGFESGLQSAQLVGMVLDPAGVGYQAFVEASKDKSRRRRLDSLAAIRRIARDETDIVTCLEQIVLCADTDVATVADRVRISTMHSSKGLEWDHVLCVGFDSGVIPSPRSMEDQHKGTPGDPWDGPRGGGVEEERRLAHVAFTRARKTLDVFAPLTRGTRSVRPSVFLPESGLDPYVGLDPFEGRAKMVKTGARTFGKGGKPPAKGGWKGFGR